MATRLDIMQYKAVKPGNILSSMFMYTVNMAAKTLISVASTAKMEHSRKWKLTDHLRFMMMLMTWVTVWFLRVLMDHIPFVSLSSTPHKLLGGFSSFGLFDLALPGTSTSSPSSSSSSSALVPSSSGYSSLDLIMNGGGHDEHSLDGLGRSLTHILELLNDLPATSRKYQFTMTMADKIMEGNARYKNEDLLLVNRTALASAFARTSSLLYSSLQKIQSPDEFGAWTSIIVKKVPFVGSYIAPYVDGLNFCVNTVSTVIRTLKSSKSQLEKKRLPRNWETDATEMNEVVAEKLGQELVWITNKLRAYGAVDEALVQWGFASGLASLSLYANPRVQSFIVKISAILFVELTREELIVSRQVKFRLLVLWIPLLCHASNGFTYPVLSCFEKAETEKAIDEAIMSLPATDQELILTNWMQDYAVSTSEWPNLQVSYDYWCKTTRDLVA